MALIQAVGTSSTCLLITHRDWYNLPVRDVSAIFVATIHLRIPSGAFWKIFACRSLGSCEYIGRIARGGASSSSSKRSSKINNKILRSKCCYYRIHILCEVLIFVNLPSYKPSWTFFMNFKETPELEYEYNWKHSEIFLFDIWYYELANK